MNKIYDSKSIWPAIIGLTFLIAILPLWLNTNISITDQPNHMARFYVMSHMDSSEALREIYRLRPGFYPYWGMYAIIKTFEPLFGLAAAGKIFLSLSLATPIIGTIALSKVVTGRVTPVSLMAASLTYSGTFAWGFANFHLALGISLIFFSLWIAMGQRIHLLKVLLFAVLALLLLSIHMISVALLGLLIGFWHLYPIYKTRKISLQNIKDYASIALVFLPSLLLIISLPREDLGEVPDKFGLIARSGAALTPFSFQHGIAIILLGIGIIITLIYFRDKNIIKANPRLMFVAISIAIVALFIPATYMNVAYLHIRLPLLVALTYLACWSFYPGKTSHIFFAVLAGLFIARIGIINHNLSKTDVAIAELRQSFAKLPKGSSIIPVRDLKASYEVNSWNHIKHLHDTAYAVVDADAFYPLMFPMYEVGFTKEYDKISVPQGFPIVAKNWIDAPKQVYGQDWQSNYDYIVYYHHGAEMKLPDYVEIIDDKSWYSILKNNSPKRSEASR